MGFLAAADELSGSAAPSAAGIEGLVRKVTSIKSVADTTARAQAVTDWPTASGAAISAANPVTVWRQDTDSIEVSEDGTTWNVIRTAEESWQNLTLQSGWAVEGGRTPQYRREGDRVYLKGAAVKTGNIASADVPATVPAGYRPTQTHLQLMGGTSNTAIPLAATTAGNLTVNAAPSVTSTVLFFDGMAWALS